VSDGLGSDGTGSDDGTSGETSDTMRERAAESTAKLWLLLQADRWLVSLAIVVFLFLGVVVGGQLHPTPAHQLIVDGDPMETLAQALVTSTVTGVTLVLTLSQLVLSQEQGAVGDQRGRMEDAMQFREDVAGVLDQSVSPTEPSAFLRALVKETERRADELGDAVEGSDASADAVDRISEFVDSLKANSQQVREGLEGATFGEFDVIRAALDYNYSWKLYAARRLEAEHEADLDEAAIEAFEGLAKALELFGPAREHFKTLYFQWELTDLSRTILWASLPSLLVSTWALMFFDADAVLGSVLGVPYSLLQVAAALSLSLLPFAVLLSYILRIVTVTKRTLSIGPFILRETDRDVEFDW
jgi:hypothetical protein